MNQRRRHSPAVYRRRRLVTALLAVFVLALAAWGVRALIDTFTTHRPLWVAQLEAAVQAERSPVVREHLVRGQREGREGLGGSVSLALLSGLMLQWLLDPEFAPSGKDVMAELRALTAED